MDLKSVARFWNAMDSLHKVFLVVALASILCTVCTDCVVCKYWPVSFNVRNPLREGFDDATLTVPATVQIPATLPAPGVKLVLYKASWCPHCVSFESSGEWEKVKLALAGTPITVETLDADADADAVKAAGIDGFPHSEAL